MEGKRGELHGGAASIGEGEGEGEHHIRPGQCVKVNDKETSIAP